MQYVFHSRVFHVRDPFNRIHDWLTAPGAIPTGEAAVIQEIPPQDNDDSP